MGHHQSSIVIHTPCEKLFLFHTDPANLGHIMPSFMNAYLLKREGLGLGSIIHVRMKAFGIFGATWVVKIAEYEPYQHITDLQISGFLKYFQHTHSFEALSATETRMTDTIDYTLPFGALGRLVDQLFVGFVVGKTFEFRHRATKRFFEGGRLTPLHG